MDHHTYLIKCAVNEDTDGSALMGLAGGAAAGSAAGGLAGKYLGDRAVKRKIRQYVSGMKELKADPGVAQLYKEVRRTLSPGKVKRTNNPLRRELRNLVKSKVKAGLGIGAGAGLGAYALYKLLSGGSESGKTEE